MLKPIEVALQALEVAKECGGELDLQMYAQAHKALASAVAELRRHDQTLTDAEASPTGADYEHIMQLLGMRAGTNADAAVLTRYTPDALELQSIARLLGLEDGAALNAIQITADVVDVMDGVIGGDNVSTVPATFDLTTGKLALVDKELGHPLLVWDGCGATIHYNGRSYNLTMLEHSVPDDLWRTEISSHIREHGYWAVLDLRALLTPSTNAEGA